jgi:hypothetical protein
MEEPRTLADEANKSLDIRESDNLIKETRENSEAVALINPEN